MNGWPEPPKDGVRRTKYVMPTGKVLWLRDDSRPCRACAKSVDPHGVKRGFICNNHFLRRQATLRRGLEARGMVPLHEVVGGAYWPKLLVEFDIPHWKRRTSIGKGVPRRPYGKEIWVDRATGELLRIWAETPAIVNEITLRDYARDVIAPLYRKPAP